MSVSLGLEILFSVSALYWIWMSCKSTNAIADLRRLPRLHVDDTNCCKPPRVTVVMPIRNGATEIRQTVEGLRSQTGVQLDLVLVNDRSDDGTARVINELSDRESWIVARHVRSLPSGWLGKCHAIQVGLSAANGDWVLFADADVRMTNDTIARAIQLAVNEKSQHVSALFRPRDSTVLAEAGYNNMVTAAHCGEYAGINRDHPNAYGGLGAFNLVSRDALKQIGDYAGLRLSVCDDSRLGMLLRRKGYRSRIFIGSDVTAAWGQTVRDHVKLFEKNLFASTGFRTFHAVSATVLMLLLPWFIAVGGAVCGLACWSPGGLAAGVALVSTTIPAATLAMMSQGRKAAIVWTPLMWPLLGMAMLNSTWKTLKTRGICWRDTFYPLETLRDFVVKFERQST